MISPALTATAATGAYAAPPTAAAPILPPALESSAPSDEAHLSAAAPAPLLLAPVLEVVASESAAPALPLPTPRESSPVTLVDLSVTPAQEPSQSPLTLDAVLGQQAAGQVLGSAADFHRQQTFAVMDAMLGARDPVTGLIPMHVRAENGALVAADHLNSGLDSGRQTAGLVMSAQVARVGGDEVRAAKYLEAAETNYANGKRLLSQGDFFVHMRDFNSDGSVKSTNLGEPGKSAPGEDNMSRVNARGYAFRGAADLYLATGKAEYKQDFDRFFQAWVRDFHDPSRGGFFVHANLNDPEDHKEISTFRGVGGSESDYQGGAGAKGNDGTVYALSGVLLSANQVLGTPQTQQLVKEQMDILLDKFRYQNGMQWENYTADFTPVSADWQNQPREGSATTSHVAIGGHTAMAAQQIIEGASQLRQQGAISEQQYGSYLDRTVGLFQDFASHSGAIDWNSGAVHNAMRLEEPDQSKRWLQGWGDASWQQAELLQTLARFQEVGRLNDVQGPEGQSGLDLLRKAEDYWTKNYASKLDDYKFDGFGNPDVYHIPQSALYLQEVAAKIR